MPSIASVDGFELELPTHFRYHYVDHDYEPMSRGFLLERVHPGGRVIDVGAHVGLYTLQMARAVGPGGHVLSVEPAEENLRYLRANVQRNAFADRVDVLAAAATDTSGTVRFHITGSSDSHGLYPHPNTPTTRIVEVPAIRLDELGTAFDFIKIDTEGAELATIAGAQQVLAAPGPLAALVEWAPQCQLSAGHGLRDLPDALRDLHFDVVALDDAARWERPVDEVASDLEAGRLPESWYGNLACTRSA